MLTKLPLVIIVQYTHLLIYNYQIFVIFLKLMQCYYLYLSKTEEKYSAYSKKQTGKWSHIPWVRGDEVCKESW